MTTETANMPAFPRGIGRSADISAGSVIAWAGDRWTWNARLTAPQLWKGERMTTERFEVSRQVAAPPATVFALLCRPDGHVAIDSSGMLQSAEGSPAAAVGDTFVVHMDDEVAQ